MISTRTSCSGLTTEPTSWVMRNLRKSCPIHVTMCTTSNRKWASMYSDAIADIAVETVVIEKWVDEILLYFPHCLSCLALSFTLFNHPRSLTYTGQNWTGR